MIENIVIASPHSRHDYIGTELGAKFNVMLIKSPEALTADYLKELNPTYVFFYIGLGLFLTRYLLIFNASFSI